MTRRCSHCSNNGHNSRTCPSRGGGTGSGSGGGGGLKLFGVRLIDGSIIKKSASMGNLSAHYHSSSSAAGSPNPESPSSDPHHEPDGYLSDDPAHASCSANRRGERKKGVPWTEEEHRLFLIGLQKLGKGDWRGIARNYVVSRTPTQVASHAQKYFIRQTNATRRKRRSSLFDMVPDMVSDHPPVPEEDLLPSFNKMEPDNANSLPSLNLSLQSEFEPMEATHEAKTEEANEPMIGSNGFRPMVPGFFPAYMPVPFPLWPPSAAPLEERIAETPHHQVLKPIPIVAKEPVNVDELVGMSQLSLGEAERGHREPSPLSLKLLGEPSRQSAFHSNAPVSGSDLSEGKTTAIQAV
ncbi:GAMYB transcription factor [Trema orientale]|uniref:GAMYB transcription factor n=1 Tax=Trema orientale TaxID=63057 RepID=A0A2P5ESN7_TREOI|nr:GAMYB transcription factor [Trema orientale]